jgi:hypothetical protein
MRGSKSGSETKTNTRQSEWNLLEQRLAVALGCLEEGHFLILETHDEEPYYVQFACDGEEGMRAEAVSNRFLAGWRRLDSIAEGRLRRLGWRPPTDIGEGPVNWWRSFESPVPVEEIAAMAIATLNKAFDVTRVSALRYRAFSSSGEAILLPTLGLARNHEGSGLLTDRVEAALKSYLELDELIRDCDGDYPVRSNDAMVYVRTWPDRNYVGVFSPVVLDVTRSPALVAKVNRINSDIRVARAFVTNNEVIMAAEVDDHDGLEAGLISAFQAVAALSNLYGDELQAQFGGRTFFQEPAGAPSGTEPEQHLGLYL